MNYLIIRFPFSSVNDEQYTLAVCLHHPVSLQSVMDVLNADSQVFTPGLSYTDGTDTIHNYTGTLQGSVQVVDDERDDFYEPIVASKLTFNMACETFPEWLMQYCDMRWASVILYKDNATNVELWRGYLIAQSLNMTVVRDKLACSMVAVDEIGMAKYMPLNKTLTTGMHTLLIGVIMEMFHNIHYYQGFTLYGINGIGFDRYYQLLGLTPTNKMLWHRNMALVNDDGDELDDLPAEMIVNLDRWLNDDKATWHDVFDAVFRYLGVTLCMGGWQGLGANDAYVLSCPTDGGGIKQYEYYFGSGSTEITGSQFAELVNPFKIGGDLQVSVEPNRYKSVTVKSEPRRWERHDYLTEAEYKPVDPDKAVRHKWGTTQDADNGPFDTYGWHKLVYIKPTTDEEKYVTLPDCQDGEGYLMARNGILPCDDLLSCVGMGQPTGAVADSLDFITFKEGATCVKIGGGEIGGVDENKHLVPFFLILNHMWSNMWNLSPYTMQSSHIADTPFLTFTPFADNGPTHPSERHYLTLSMRVKFIRENMSIGSKTDGSPLQWLWFASPGVGHTMRVLDWQSPAILMPCEESEYPNFEDPTSIYTGNVSAWNQIYFTARLRVGDHYWNGNAWVTTPATCDIRLWNTTSEVTEVDKYGIRTIETKNYYYTFGSPYAGNTSVDKLTDPKMLVDCVGVSQPNAPLQGQLKLEILGQIRFQNTIPGSQGVANSVPFILIDNVDIGWTDAAEIMGENIVNKRTVFMDYYSETKEEMERELEMASPIVDGFFDNTLVFDGGKAIHNVATVIAQDGSTDRQPEELLANKLAQQYSDGQCFVELSTPIHYDDNLHNVGFVVKGLTEVGGTFLPVKRTFDYRMERMRVKLQRVNIPLAE